MPATWIVTREMPLADLERFPGNARRGDTGEIRRSIRRHGQYRAIVVRVHDGKHTILAGNHTFDALRQLAASPPSMEDLLAGVPESQRQDQERAARALLDQLGRKAIRCELIKCTDDEALRINLADNRTAELGDYDTGALAELLKGLDEDFAGTGWKEEDVTAILEQAEEAYAAGDFGDGDGAPGRGELLALAGVTLGEPRHKAEDGQVWALGDHRLVIEDLFTGWPVWAPLLDGDVTFLPYPTPLAPHSPDPGPLVMVQPDPFLAGHLLDKWQDITGAEPVVINSPAATA